MTTNDQQIQNPWGMLREVFLWTETQAKFGPIPIAVQFGIPRSMASRMLKALEAKGLVYEGPYGWRGYHWDEGPEQAFDQAFNGTDPEEYTMSTTTGTTPTTDTTPAHTCRCGCNLQVSKNRQYRPGHDARHASAIARDVARQALETGTTDLSPVSALPSQALQDKAVRQATALIAKGQPKAEDGSDATERAAKALATSAWEMGEAKIGRWVYPARRRPGGRKAQVNTRRDGQGQWKDLDPAKFQPLGSN